MVLNKWAVVTKSAPPPANLRPLARSVLHHPKLTPAGYKIPYVIRPFIKDWHTSSLQHIENRGMYKEELSIERSRFPRQQRTFVIQTDGALNEREAEFPLPPVMLLFHDRLTAHRQRQAALAKIGQLRPAHSWERPTKNRSRRRSLLDGEEGGSDSSITSSSSSSSSSDSEDDDGDREHGRGGDNGGYAGSDKVLCNALEFPYCVPRGLRTRRPVPDPLSSKAITGMRSKSQ